MPRQIAFAVAFAALLLACPVSPVQAADQAHGLSVPDALQGAWYVGQSCNDVTSYFFRGDGWSVGITEQADSQAIVASSSAFSVLKVEPDGSMIVSSYWKDPTTGGYVPAQFKLTPENAAIEGTYVAPAGATKTPKISEIRCDNPEVAGKPWPLASLYLAGLTRMLESVSKVQRACNAEAKACAGAIVAVLDLNHDGKVSPAEIVSFFRAATKLGFLLGKTVPGTTMVHAAFTLDDVSGAELGAAVVGPIFAQVVMANIDYDGDGFIEQNELETFLGQVGIPPASGYVGQLIGSAKSSVEQAGHSLGALEQLLGAFGGH
ncbi:MAG: hypothetical protein ACREFP_01620 [Acetobacteraceae bacterium]